MARLWRALGASLWFMFLALPLLVVRVNIHPHHQQRQGEEHEPERGPQGAPQPGHAHTFCRTDRPRRPEGRRMRISTSRPKAKTSS